MAISDEERRALDYQQQQRNRHRFERETEQLLRGDTAAARGVRDAWSAITSRDETFHVGEHQ